MSLFEKCIAVSVYSLVRTLFSRSPSSDGQYRTGSWGGSRSGGGGSAVHGQPGLARDSVQFLHWIAEAQQQGL